MNPTTPQPTADSRGPERATPFSVLPASVAFITPIAMFAGIYLLFAGHNNPGGGFAAGLVFGAIVTLRSLAGEPMRIDATTLICAGVLIVVAVAAAPLFFGHALLDQKVVSFTVPVLGKIKSGSALPFDIGVTAIVVGLVIALLTGLRTTEVDSHKGTDSDKGTST